MAAEAAASDADVEVLEVGWLASHQAPDGMWRAATFDALVRGRPATPGPVADRGRPRQDVLATSLALRAHLEAGHGPTSDGPYGPHVRAAVDALATALDGDGRLGDPAQPYGATNHAVALDVLTTLVALHGRAEDAARLRRAFEGYRASRAAGARAWTEERGPSGVRPIGWVARALCTARTARPDPTRAGDATGTDGPAATARSTPPRPRSAAATAVLEAMAADPGLAADEAVVAGWGLEVRAGLEDRRGERGRLALGVAARRARGGGPTSRGAPTTDPAVAVLLALGPGRADPPALDDAIGTWLATDALYAVGGAPWATWERAMKATVVGTQRHDGTRCTTRGSWDPVGDFADEGGRVVATAAGALALLVWYRYDTVLGVAEPRAPTTSGRDAPPHAPPPPAIRRLTWAVPCPEAR